LLAKQWYNSIMKKKIMDYFKTSDIKYIYALAGVVFFASFALMSWFLYKAFVLPADDGFVDEDVVKEEITEEDCDYKRKIDGTCVESERYTDSELVAVMIENNLEAWPLAGLAEASVVYEAPVEGDIPRFMAIYVLGEEVDQVGPVRSARPYYLDWVSEYGKIMFMHVGGSPDALDLVDEYNLFSINEFYRGWYFWRSEGRTAPHNTYTSTELWNKSYEKYSEYYDEKDYIGWQFEKIENCETDCVGEIDIPIASPSSYHAVWKFNTSTQKYTRFQGGEQAFEMDGKEIFADTVIVQMADVEVIDEIGRKEIGVVGSGEAVVFRNGKVFEGVWKKTDRISRTEFFAEDGSAISLQAGKIWIEILSTAREAEWE